MKKYNHPAFGDVYMWVVKQTKKFWFFYPVKLHVQWWSRCGKYFHGSEVIYLTKNKWDEFYETN